MSISYKSSGLEPVDIGTVYVQCENQMNRVYLAQNEKSSQQKAFCYRHDIIVT